jgi:(p)ppGpp synthase/HD superfamily hydrolase
MKYTDQIEKAIKVASRAHKEQLRKGTDMPYISHPFSVMAILSEFTEDEDVLIAGLLHDILEDADAHEYGVAYLQKEFGNRTTEIIQEVSEKKDNTMNNEREKDTWKSRKD